MTAAEEPLIGVINAGSSSLKFSFYEGEKRLLIRAGRRLGTRPRPAPRGRTAKQSHRPI